MNAQIGFPGRLVIAVIAFAGCSVAPAQSARSQGATAEPAQQASPQRQRDVARRGADVMPFNLEATTHVFTKTARGGIQRVVAKNPSDLGQVRLVREHLREIQLQFEHGDFSGPAHIHGQDMPGLAELQAAPRGAISLAYQQVQAGAQLTYSSRDRKLVAALHRWFDAQLSDHGKDAMAGHLHHGDMPAR
jgi:hypothetical protein